ncbi:NusB antitermination factor [Ruminococcaceae bacterium YRB3002]|nr:NusB antitermination factor [Ruminococcaceae bacterium YRB3002]
MRQPVLTDKVITGLINSNNMRELCALMLYQVYFNGAYTNLVLRDVDRLSDNRANLRSLRAMFYGTVTYTYTIDFLVRHITKRDVQELDDITATLIRLGCWQILFSTSIPVHAAVSETVNIAGRYTPGSKGLINAILRKIADAPDDMKDPDNYKPDVATSLKSEIYGILKRDYGRKRAYDIGKALLASPRLTIRFNPERISASALENSLMEDSFSVSGASFLPEVLAVETGHKSIESSEAYKKGLFIVQNEAAALASHIAAPAAGMKILDCCAAPGGKTTHLAELTGDNADILALDSNPSRLGLLRENVERLGLKSIRYQTADATDMSRIDGLFDIVLADCPCSGLGIMCRKPDIRLNMTYDRIRDIMEVQHRIIREAATKVKPGGALIYCTCTVNKDENEAQVKSFLEENGDFGRDDILPYLPGDIIMDEERINDAKNGSITLLPDKDSCDGFYIARLVRNR